MTQSSSRTPSAHAQHDVELIAAIVDADPSLTPAERDRADRLIAACDACSRLHADLIAIRTAVATAPAPARPRAFLLRDADVARLRPRGWRQAIAVFGSARDGVSRPLALGLTTFGLVALLVTSIPAGSLGAGAAGQATSAQAPAPGVAAASAAASAAPAPAAAPAASAEVPETAASILASPDDGSVFSGAGGPDASDTTADRLAEGETSSSGEPTEAVAAGWSIWQILAGLSLVAGVGLLLLRRVANRFA
jgi:anti-sigma factor RsiW